MLSHQQENVKQSLRHKINAWGFVFSNVGNDGTLAIQLQPQCEA